MENDLKYELQHLISGNEPIRQGSLIQTASHHLRRSKNKNTTSKENKFTKEQEEWALEEFARQNAIWFTAFDKTTYLAEGAEQQVFFMPENFSVIKLNTGIFYACWEDYLHSLLLHNIFFENTTYTLLGFTRQEGLFCAVVSQPYIDFDEATDLDKVKSFLQTNGFEHKRNNDYHNPNLGIILEDLHDENVLMREGVLFVIDSIFYLTDVFWKI